MIVYREDEPRKNGRRVVVVVVVVVVVSSGMEAKGMEITMG